MNFFNGKIGSVFFTSPAQHQHQVKSEYLWQEANAVHLVGSAQSGLLRATKQTLKTYLYTE